MHKKVYNGDDYVYTEPGVMVVYEATGVITQILTHNDALDTVAVDLNWLQQHNPSRYNYLQEKVNEGLSARNRSLFD